MYGTDSWAGAVKLFIKRFKLGPLGAEYGFSYMLQIILFLLLAPAAIVSGEAVTPLESHPSGISTVTIRRQILSEKAVRGIHLSSWGAGSKKLRGELIARINNSVINAVVVAIKEVDGKVYIPGVETAHKYGAYAPAIAQPEEMLKDFKGAGLYTVARIVVFKDKVLPLARKDLAVRTPDGAVWRATRGATWLDPYNKEVWVYTLDVAERAAKLGFDEVQFDYIRYPTEGRTALCRYAKQHTAKNAIANLKDFLVYARGRLKPYNVKISVDVFGLTTTAKDDMGIGQDIKTMAQEVDYVYPMMYPSHYYAGGTCAR